MKKFLKYTAYVIGALVALFIYLSLDESARSGLLLYGAIGFVYYSLHSAIDKRADVIEHRLNMLDQLIRGNEQTLSHYDADRLRDFLHDHEMSKKPLDPYD